ncbi:site-specific DNA-methyltransferase [Selenomonas noxia]
MEAIRELFPNAVTEVMRDGQVVRAIDFDVLRQELSREIVEGRTERYAFTWPDKSAAILAANAPIAATLRPVVEESVGRDGTEGGFDSENLYIEGENLKVLKLMEETYLHKVKMIYIDPPYNTGNNLMYKNDYAQTTGEYIELSHQINDEGNRMSQNPETNGRFHTDWLNMIYPCLRVARNLLREDGILVCAIDENEVHALSMMLKEIFGESTYDVTCVTVMHNPRGQQGKNFSRTNEYALFVYPNSEKIINDKQISEEDVSWTQFRNWGGESERRDAKNCFYPIIVKNGVIEGFGEVSPDAYHPKQTEYVDGCAYVYPIDRSGIERKWRYARQSVELVSEMLRARETDSGYEIEIGKTFGLQKTVWSEKKYDANEYGTKAIADLIPGSGFSFPKSIWTVYDSLYAGVGKDKDAIVLDFFSGSATTAHATMLLNADDGGNRKFIMVQIPERTDQFLDISAPFRTICEIGKERIRRAGAKIAAEAGEKAAGLDIGFRCLRLDSSNMNEVYYSPDAVTQDDLFAQVDNVKSDRTPEDLLFQTMLDLGILLSAPIVEEEIAGRRVFNVADGFLLACFDRAVTDETVTAIAKRKPYYAVFRDASMADDSALTNFDQLFAAYSPATVRRVL